MPVHRKHIAGAAVGVAVVLGLMLAGIALARTSGSESQTSPHGSTAYMGTELEGRPAPDFRLLDQSGAPTTLAGFQGRAVVIAFLDPVCTDVCPLTALQFRQTAQALGEKASNVMFVAVNVNREARDVSDVAAATQKWGMADRADWRFLTGSEQELQATWNAYKIVAHGGPKPDKPDEQAHSGGVYIIDGSGRQRWYISTPMGPGHDLPTPSLASILTTRLQELLG